MPIRGRWTLHTFTEEEVVEWVVCSIAGASTEVLDVVEGGRVLGPRKGTEVWSTPGKIQDHIEMWAAVPFWAATLVTGAIPVSAAARWFYRRCRRVQQSAGFCPCGYNLTGNESGKCPECGIPVEQP